jgi:hypothetical protein
MTLFAIHECRLEYQELGKENIPTSCLRVSQFSRTVSITNPAILNELWFHTAMAGLGVSHNTVTDGPLRSAQKCNHPSEASSLHCNPTQPPFPSLILALQAKIETASVSIVTAGATVTLSGSVARCAGLGVLEGHRYMTSRPSFI